jgi:DNA processing protein
MIGGPDGGVLLPGHPVRVLRAGARGYPALLALAPDRPAEIRVQGTLPPLGRYVAVVGTRFPGRFGTEFVRRIVPRLVERGWSIVSGLARGLDGEAHRSALAAHAHTVAVFGSGLGTDVIWPPEHVDLARSILDAGGALVSEQPDGERARKQHLIARNRIQSGLSVAVVVGGASLRSGTMHTVRFAAMQGRLVVAPLPPTAYLGEPDCEALVALTGLDGPVLAERIGAKGLWDLHLRVECRGRPLALAIASKLDYDRAFDRIEERERELAVAAGCIEREGES